MAVASSVLVHLVLFVFALNSAKGGTISGGDGAPQGDEQAVTISLAGLRGGAAAAAEAPTQEELRTLLQRISAEESSVVASDQASPVRGNLDSLLTAIDQQQSKANSVAGSGRSETERGGRGEGAAGADLQQASKKAEAQTKGAGQTAGSPSTGALWGEIEPCWRKAPGASSVPVSLEVSLTGRGTIAVPPRILRPASVALNEQRLTAEARAIAAITACVPYSSITFSGTPRAFRIDFAPSS